MAKLRGPLMSVGASGTIGHTITYLATQGGAVAQRTPMTDATPTHAQSAERSIMAAAARRWRHMTNDQRDQWAAAAARYGQTGWILYCAETYRQRPPNDTDPLLPEHP